MPALRSPSASFGLYGCVALAISCGGLRSKLTDTCPDQGCSDASTPQPLCQANECAPPTGCVGACPDASAPMDGGADAGSGPADGGANGGWDGGTLPELTWTRIIGVADSEFRAVGGAGGIVYVTGGVGRIHRFQSGAWTQAYKEPGNAALNALWVSPQGEVFAGGQGVLLSCLAGCQAQGGFAEKIVSDSAINGICGLDAQNVYAVGRTSSNVGVLYRFDGSVWSRLSADTGSLLNRACWVAPNGHVFIAAHAAVVRYDGLGLTSEPIDYQAAGLSTNDMAVQAFESIWGSGSTVFATGYRRRVIARAGGAWSFVFNPNGMESNYALAGSGPQDAYAAGGSSTGQTLSRYDGAAEPPTWRYVAAFPDLLVLGMWAASAYEYWAVGVRPGTVEGAVYRGTR